MDFEIDGIRFSKLLSFKLFLAVLSYSILDKSSCLRAWHRIGEYIYPIP